ncbi:non-ribosomal peptide synthetase [Erwinia piriflorinigrans]|uniref:Peptide synthase n=1 Tax=Erwinia piriflorinigrans CFBP 5888 TaxID=1161919 RepID=V5ZDI9_9GAMM|nr:non-ribosomal peptide synthetase [Erwinia piriflorinigrans]CCG89151.1 peptide synthase [Erwinia piriflorinigrans CFBP 5888]
MASSVEQFPCFHHVIQFWARTRPEHIAFHYLADGETVSTTLSYAELDRQARKVAIILQQLGLSRQPVLLQFRSGIDFIVAFFGCLYAGTIAVSAYPPGTNRSKSDRLEKLIASSMAKTILTNQETLEDVEREAGNRFDLLCIEQARDANISRWQSPDLGEEDIAFLQYSSGSTGDPKGVVITHRNLMSNQAAIREGMGNGDHTVFASWLPLFHDMGLIGNVMQPLYLGVSCWLMPPMAFLQKPIRWLRLIAACGATCTGGPDFAYILCVNKVSEAEREGLDLSRWQVAYNGAEPIRSDTLSRFQSAYAPYGFAAGSLYPCYGLAEATLFVSGHRAGQPAVTLRVSSERLSAGKAQPAEKEEAATTLVSSGQLWGGTEVLITHPERLTRCTDGEVGEIWLRGDSVTTGYWNAPQANAELLVPSDGEAKPALRTGDLGFMHQGQLYVTGRLKELLIIRGRNHYPQDIEFTVQQTCGEFIPGNGVAFMADDQLVVVQEVRRDALRRFDAAKALQRVRGAIAQQHGLMLAQLVVVKPGSVAKTSSGKLRRRYMQSQWQAGDISAAGAPAGEQPRPDSPLYRLLSQKGLNAQPGNTLNTLGVDSLLRLELHTLLEQLSRRKIPLEWLLDDMTLEVLDRQINDLAIVPPVNNDLQPGSSLMPTPWQQAIWLHQQTQPEAPFYNLATVLAIPAATSAQRVQQALDELGAAHPQLCATLTETGWLSGPGVQLEQVDLANGNPCERLSWLQAYRARPFDLSDELPWRCALLCQSERRSELVIVVHHAAIDHQAGQTLLSDLRQLLQGGYFPPAAVPLPHMLAGLQQLANPDRQADAVWLKALLATPEQLDLGLPVPAKPAAIANVRHALTSQQTAALRQYAQQQGVTLHVLLAAGFAAMLARYSGETQIALGVPVSVREPQQSRWLTNAVNMLPLPLDLSAHISLNELIQQAGSATRRLLQHRFLPYVSLLQQVRQHQPQRNSLYHAVFACQSDGSEALPFVPALAAQKAWSLLAFPAQGQIVLELEFDPARADIHSAQRLLAHLQQWLDSALAQPDLPVAQVGYLTVAEQAASGLLTRPAACQRQVEDTVSRFLRQVTRQPHSPAVEDVSGVCSYAQLCALAEGYAALLERQHIQPGERIALAMTRDRHLLAAMLAIHASGGCYVPMDLSYPPERLNMMMQDSQCRVVLAHDVSLFPDHHVITPEQLRPDVIRPLAAVSADALAYVLYTSGSTGRPKGVQVTQRNISSLLAWAEESLSLTERARVLASTSICFDLSVFEIFVPLCLGTCCVLVGRILDLIEQPQHISLLNTVPSAVEALLQANAFPAGVQVALVAGEPFRQTLVERLLHSVALPRLLDLYGPTEDTVYSTCARRYAGGEETIGSPLPGTRAYLLDGNQQPVAENMPGELWLAGDKLSLGYLQRPELNATAFIVPPALRHLENRAYRTGDRVRRLPDGRLVYLGRLDHQIKLHGYRIETTEVEKSLLQIASVQQAVVGVVQDATGEPQLAAWYVAADGDPGISQLRHHLLQRLPPWMIPSAWLAMPALPQTPNGKVDRHALPAPLANITRQQVPQREDEKQLAEIWQQVLGQRPQTRDAHFISLGGNSLLAIRLRQQLCHHFESDIPLALLLRHPVLGEQAEALACWLQSASADEDIEEISL